MRWILMAVLLFTYALPLSALQAAPRTTITGGLGYALGAEQQTILQRDRSFIPGSRYAWSTRIPTAIYNRRLDAPIGGFSYRADLVLQFYQDRLGVILVRWPVQIFANVDEWKVATKQLRQQLLDTYARSMIEDDYVSAHRDNTMLSFKDPSGNRIRLLSGDFQIVLAYLWVVYYDAHDRAPKPKGNF